MSVYGFEKNYGVQVRGRVYENVSGINNSSKTKLGDFIKCF